MSIQSDRQIAALCGIQLTRNTDGAEHLTSAIVGHLDRPPMITPFVPHQVRLNPEEPEIGMSQTKIVSYGLSSYGYDVRLADEFKIFTNVNSSTVDPLVLDERAFHDVKGPSVLIPPNSYLLGHTIETFDIPNDIQVVCLGKSTYARCGAIVNVTPIEPGFKGQVVIEISNATPLPVRIYANQGIAQFLFFKGDEPCLVSYADRGGKYQGQSGIQLAKG